MLINIYSLLDPQSSLASLPLTHPVLLFYPVLSLTLLIPANLQGGDTHPLALPKDKGPDGRFRQILSAELVTGTKTDTRTRLENKLDVASATRLVIKADPY